MSTDPSKVHKFTIKRLGTTQGSSGGQIPAYSTASRSGLPTELRGRAIMLNQKEKLEHGVRGDLVGWKFLIPETDPQIDERDRIDFDYIEGQSHQVEIIASSRARSADGRFYKAFGQEKSTE